ncbi:MAG: hypothetical protein C0600_15430 [Ignavibacteria bacterium]|nr:MAG: hypothetical protein C0600_15430 [Ignavibacteria bacterium]
MDVVLSTREENSRSRRLNVHFFQNAGAEFELVQSLERSFVFEAIEVGFSIERGTAFVTEKTGEFGWRITGYTVRDNIFRRIYQWTTERMAYRGRETAVGYEHSYDGDSHVSEDHFYGTNSSRSFLRQKYYTLPVFRAGDDIPAALQREIGDSTALMIVKGGSSWHGPEDCSLFCSAEYDSSFVYFTVTVNDDRLLYAPEKDSADVLSLHFDLSRKTRVRPGGDEQDFSPNAQLILNVFMGDGEERTPVVELEGKKLAEQYAHLVDVSVSTKPDRFNEFVFRIRLPRPLFENETALPGAGFACTYHDVDYPANLHWVSISSTSRGYRENAPSSYGRLQFISDARHHYEWDDLATHRMANGMRRAGILP